MKLSSSENDLREDIALFRYGLIAEIAREPPGKPGTYARMKKIAARKYDIPGSRRRRVAAETLRCWIRDYRAKGIEGLYPKTRQDKGTSRRIPQKVLDVLLEIKEENPKLTVKQVIKKAREHEDVFDNTILAESTVHRLLARNGLMEKGLKGAGKDRRSFSYHHAGELWMSDVMHGPAVAAEGKRKHKSYLLAFIDDATRVITHASFDFSENTTAFLPVFKKALMRRGLPKRLYVDNGAAYRSRQLELVCAKLGIILIHARPYQPQGKGKIERFFRTVRIQFLNPLKIPHSIDELNRLLWAWVEGEYHQSPHRGLDGDTPLERWALRGARLEMPGPTMDLDDLMLWEETRKVRTDRTVSLRGKMYEVQAGLSGQKVLLRFDPSGSMGPAIQVWEPKSRIRLEDAKPVDTYGNCFVKRDTDEEAVPFSVFPAEGE